MNHPLPLLRRPRGLLLLSAALGIAGLLGAQEKPPAPAADVPGPNGWRFTELRRFRAEEARQGVAVDRSHLYAIGNYQVAKYPKAGGARVALWECPEGQPLTHLNSGRVHEGRLYAAHSNYPGVPHVSSVETWDPATLRHAGTINFGRTDGSLTWIDRRDGRWIACFVHYAKRGGEPGRGPEWTRLAEFDDDWRPTGRGWVFPPDLMAQLAWRGYSVSGGALGPDGLLFVTGHDNPELYVLEFPRGGGSALRWLATIPVPAEGQAFAWDPADAGVIHLILKRERQIITGRITREGR